jgi:hypothetical protein
LKNQRTTAKTTFIHIFGIIMAISTNFGKNRQIDVYFYGASGVGGYACGTAYSRVGWWRSVFAEQKPSETGAALRRPPAYRGIYRAYA